MDFCGRLILYYQETGAVVTDVPAPDLPTLLTRLTLRGFTERRKQN